MTAPETQAGSEGTGNDDNLARQVYDHYGEPDLTPVIDAQPLIATPGEFSVPAEFWATPRLQRVQTEAWARDMRPEGLLAAVLARMTASLDPRVVIADTGKGPAPIHLFVALIGSPGAGKTTTTQAAGMMLGPGADAPLFHPATGEGLHAHYRERRRIELGEGRRDASGRGAKESVEVWVNRNGLGLIDEIATLFNKASSHSQTLMSDLRAMWAGSAVGTTTKSVESRLSVPAMGYRISLLAGAQISLAARLLGVDLRGDGTFQRFMLMPVWMDENEFVDGHTPMSPQDWENPANALWPNIPVLEDLTRKPLGADRETIPATECVVVCVPEHIRAELKAARRRGQALDAVGDIGHAAYNRLRWAAALAIFEERLEIRDEDWKRAGMLMALSGQVVELIEDVRDRAASEQASRDGVLQAGRDAARNSLPELSRRCAKEILRIVDQHASEGTHDALKGCTKRCIRVLTRGLAPLRDATLATLVAGGELDLVGTAGARGARYVRRASDGGEGGHDA